jgi:hypothetical protein
MEHLRLVLPIGKKSTVECHLDTVTFRIGNSLYAQLEINRTHNTITELLFDKRFERSAKNLCDLVEAIN